MSQFAKIILVNKAGIAFDEFKAKIGTSLWFNIRKRGIPIGASCSGVGVCCKCFVKILDTANINWDSSLLPLQGAFQVSLLESDNLKKNGFELCEGEVNPTNCTRISCLMRVAGDTTVQAEYW